MDRMPIISMLLPEEFLIFTLELIILGEKVHFPRVLGTSVVAVVGTYFIRLLPFPFGFNAIISVALFIVLFMVLLRMKFKQAFIATLLGM